MLQYGDVSCKVEYLTIVHFDAKRYNTVKKIACPFHPMILLEMVDV